MRTTIPLQSQLAAHRASRPFASRNSSSPFPYAPLALLAAATALFAAQSLFAAQTPAAQTPAPPPATTPAQKPVHPHKRPSPAHPLASPAQSDSATVTPPVPEPPHWPVNDKPVEASVVWDSQGLRIDAVNSSLQQIMKDVSTATGTKVEGLGSDQRVFGDYGPGHDWRSGTGSAAPGRAQPPPGRQRAIRRQEHPGQQRRRHRSRRAGAAPGTRARPPWFRARRPSPHPAADHAGDAAAPTAIATAPAAAPAAAATATATAQQSPKLEPAELPVEIQLISFQRFGNQ